MPVTQAGLPFDGSTADALASSQAAAEAMAEHAPGQLERYVRWLLGRGGRGDDWTCHRETGMKRQSICARRRPLIGAGLMTSDGYVEHGGERYAVWVLQPGLVAGEILRQAREWIRMDCALRDVKRGAA